MMEAVDVGDFVRIRRPVTKAKREWLSGKAKSVTGAQAYYVFVPGEESEYRFKRTDLEKID